MSKYGYLQYLTYLTSYFKTHHINSAVYSVKQHFCKIWWSKPKQSLVFTRPTTRTCGRAKHCAPTTRLLLSWTCNLNICAPHDVWPLSVSCWKWLRYPRPRAPGGILSAYKSRKQQGFLVLLRWLTKGFKFIVEYFCILYFSSNYYCYFFAMSMKHDLSHLDRNRSFALWQVKMMAILTQAKVDDAFDEIW